MPTQTQGQENSGGFARAFDLFRLAAQRIADALIGAVRAQASSVVDAYRRELRRACLVYFLCRGVLLFTWSAAAMVVLALELAWWDSHRVAVSLGAAAGLAILAAVSALVAARLTQRGRQT